MHLRTTLVILTAACMALGTSLAQAGDVEGYAGHSVVDDGIVTINWDETGSRTYGIANLHNEGWRCEDAVWSIKRAHTESSDPASDSDIRTIVNLANDLRYREQNGSIYAKFVDCLTGPHKYPLGLLLIDFEGKRDGGPNGWDEAYYVTEH